jgi:hypothetical protein
MIFVRAWLRRWLTTRVGRPRRGGGLRFGRSISGRRGGSVDGGVARALNVQIRRVAEMLPGGLEHEYGFSCECGCGEIVRLCAADLERKSGAWLDGHQAPPRTAT